MFFLVSSLRSCCQLITGLTKIFITTSPTFCTCTRFVFRCGPPATCSPENQAWRVFGFAALSCAIRLTRSANRLACRGNLIGGSCLRVSCFRFALPKTRFRLSRLRWKLCAITGRPARLLQGAGIRLICLTRPPRCPRPARGPALRKCPRPCSHWRSAEASSISVPVRHSRSRIQGRSRRRAILRFRTGPAGPSRPHRLPPAPARRPNRHEILLPSLGALDMGRH